MSLRFKLDENLPADAKALLANAGHDAHSLVDERLGGSADPRVYEASQSEDRVLITLDLDFSDIRLYPPANHRGIWVLRPPSQSIERILNLLRGALTLVGREPTDKRLWIVEPGNVRIRQ